jgi:hypothetical protein
VPPIHCEWRPLDGWASLSGGAIIGVSCRGDWCMARVDDTTAVVDVEVDWFWVCRCIRLVVGSGVLPALG